MSFRGKVGRHSPEWNYTVFFWVSLFILYVPNVGYLGRFVDFCNMWLPSFMAGFCNSCLIKCSTSSPC